MGKERDCPSRAQSMCKGPEAGFRVYSHPIRTGLSSLRMPPLPVRKARLWGPGVGCLLFSDNGKEVGRWSKH